LGHFARNRWISPTRNNLRRQKHQQLYVDRHAFGAAGGNKSVNFGQSHAMRDDIFIIHPPPGPTLVNPCARSRVKLSVTMPGDE
jgi:hypothetical protein